MDVEMMVERLKVLSTQAPASVRRLLESPGVQTLTTAVILLRTIPAGKSDAALRDFLETVRPRSVDDIAWIETELDPDLVAVLAGQNVATIGDARRLSDGDLMKLRDMSLDRLAEVRAVERKYVRLWDPAAHQKSLARSGPADLSVLQRIEYEVRRGVDNGESPTAISKRIGIPPATIRPMYRKAKERGAR